MASAGAKSPRLSPYAAQQALYLGTARLLAPVPSGCTLESWESKLLSLIASAGAGGSGGVSGGSECPRDRLGQELLLVSPGLKTAVTRDAGDAAVTGFLAEAVKNFVELPL